MKLLSPLITPHLRLRNRVVMAPMNRRRATQGIPPASAPIYYGQRAEAGLIITENTAIAPNAIGSPDTPGIYNAAQQAAWKRVVDEVHARDGKVFIQLVHAGRIGHPLNHEGGAALVAPSAIKAAERILTPGGRHLPMPEPEALSIEGVKGVIEAHVQAAVSAMEIGFDGVEIHGAHGFLPDQFLHPDTNHRTDRYGGSIAGRSRFLLEIVEGVAAAIGEEYTGVRLSPFATLNDLRPYEEETATHQYIIDALAQMGICYVHLSAIESSIPIEYIRDVRMRFPGLLILAGGYTADSGEAILQKGLADLIAYGRPFIANPDLVQRFCHGDPLAVPDEDTFYHGGDKGYVDYPISCATGCSCLA